MYLPEQFDEQEPQQIRQLMATHPLATWVAQSSQGLVANLIPFELDEGRGRHGTLLCHVAKANPVWQEMVADQASLVVFQGPQAYVSPNWYPSKREHGKAVPTWNYAMVQAKGVAKVVESREARLAIVTRLTQRHESGQARPWQVGDAPAEYIEQMLNAIVAIEIPIDSLQGKWKMHQNHPLSNKQGVVAGLTHQGGEQALAVATLVEQRIASA